MSKVSFRARALDVTKHMPVYIASEIPDLPDFATINRSVPIMPTGMEKDEEGEHHLQRALSAQQVYGTSETLVIPIPEVFVTEVDHYEKLYTGFYKQPKQYVHMQACGVDQEIPDYDMDLDDEVWLTQQGNRMDITPLKFEQMMDRLEKGSGQQVVTLHEAKALLKEDDDLIIAIYDYWLNKRLTMKHPLIMQVKSEKRDGSTTNNPYVAFRRRSEKMQTRKNRKNDEVSYERMLKLRRDMNRALTLIEMIKRREKTKKEMLQLTIEVLEKRQNMGDYSGEHLAAAERERLAMPKIPKIPFSSNWPRPSDMLPVKKKREYKKRRIKQGELSRKKSDLSGTSPLYGMIDVVHPDIYSSEDEPQSPVLSHSDHDDENDPDGPFAFRRSRSCLYNSPLLYRHGNWSWESRHDGGLGDSRHRYSLLTLPPPYKCVGYGRRRVGRGGRILIDRAETAWDDGLCKIDILDESSVKTTLSDHVIYIRDRKINHFRPRTPPTECEEKKDSHGTRTSNVFHSSQVSTSFPSHLNAARRNYHDSFHSNLDELIRLQNVHKCLFQKASSDISRTLCTPQSFLQSSPHSIDSTAAHKAISAVVDAGFLRKSLDIIRIGTDATSRSQSNVAPALTISSSDIPSVPNVSMMNGPKLSDCVINLPLSTTLLSRNHALSSSSSLFPSNNTYQTSSSSFLSLTSPELHTALQKNNKNIVTHNSILKLTPANGTNTTIIKPGQSESLHGLSKDTAIPMDVT